MRIVITGGTGLIGQALVKNLVDDGHEVVILTRTPEKKGETLPEGVRAVGWDGRTAEGWLDAADGADAIVNLAGENLSGGLWTKKRKQRILSSRTNAGQAVTQAVEKAAKKPKVVVQASAVGYYGPRRGEKVTEKTSAGKDFLADVCAEWEASSAAVEKLGVRRPVIRTGLVLSGEGGVLPLMALPFKLFVGGPVGSGRQYLPWIHLDDEVRAIRLLIENERANGPFNLSAPNPLTNRGFGKALAAALHRPYFMPAPGFMMRLVLGEMSVLVLEGQKAVPQRLLDLGFKFRYPQVQAALESIYPHKKDAKDEEEIISLPLNR